MQKKRFIGIFVLGSVLIFIGGFMTLILIVEVIDSLRIFGLSSLYIQSLTAFKGFFIYAWLPIFFYSAGIGLILYRKWAFKLMIYFFPPTLVYFSLILGCQLAKENSFLFSESCVELFFTNFDIFVAVTSQISVIVFLIFIYLRQPHIQQAFD